MPSVVAECISIDALLTEGGSLDFFIFLFFVPNGTVFLTLCSLQSG